MKVSLQTNINLQFIILCDKLFFSNKSTLFFIKKQIFK